MNIRIASILWLFISLHILQGCGYRNPYTGNKDQRPTTHTIYLSVWENRTNEMGLGNLIYQRAADKLRQIGFLRFAGDAGQADYILSGAVIGVDFPASSFDTTDKATNLNALIRIDYRLTDRISDRTVWQTTETIRGESYPVGSDAIRTQSNKMTVLETIADDIAEHIYLRVTDTLTTSTGSKQ